jgi:hypothetical protein
VEAIQMKQTPEAQVIHTKESAFVALSLIFDAMPYDRIAEIVWRSVHNPERLLLAMQRLSLTADIIAIDSHIVAHHLGAFEVYAGTDDDMRLAMRAVENLRGWEGSNVERQAALAVIDILRRRGLIKKKSWLEI